jgi:adenylate cyclase class IV
MKEIETKIIDINEKEVRDKLVKIGAKKLVKYFTGDMYFL